MTPVASTTRPAADWSPANAPVYFNIRKIAPINSQVREPRHIFLRTLGITDVLIGSIFNYFESLKVLISVS
jgi:hypothetical protein